MIPWNANLSKSYSKLFKGLLFIKSSHFLRDTWRHLKQAILFENSGNFYDWDGVPDPHIACHRGDRDHPRADDFQDVKQMFLWSSLPLLNWQKMLWPLSLVDGKGGWGLPCLLPLRLDGLLPLQGQEQLQGGCGGQCYDEKGGVNHNWYVKVHTNHCK